MFHNFSFLKKLVLATTLCSAPMAYGDIYDRISNCEDRGGGSCVFDILRELASRPTDGGGVPQIAAGKYRYDGSSETYIILQVHRSGERITGLTIQYTYRMEESHHFTCYGATCTGDYGTIQIKSPSRFAFLIANNRESAYNYHSSR